MFAFCTLHYPTYPKDLTKFYFSDIPYSPIKFLKMYFNSQQNRLICLQYNMKIVQWLSFNLFPTISQKKIYGFSWLMGVYIYNVLPFYNDRGSINIGYILDQFKSIEILVLMTIPRVVCTDHSLWNNRIVKVHK